MQGSIYTQDKITSRVQIFTDQERTMNIAKVSYKNKYLCGTVEVGTTT